MKPERNKKPRLPLEKATLEQLALSYVGRYATTKAKLASYLGRKLRERGWGGSNAPEIEPLVERLAELGYLDDRAFASARAASLQRRGYGERRVAQALYAAGIDAEDSAEARNQSRSGALAAGLRFAERRRIGPFASAHPDREARQKAMAAMMRAGHPLDIVRRIVDAEPGKVPESDTD